MATTASWWRRSPSSSERGRTGAAAAFVTALGLVVLPGFRAQAEPDAGAWSASAPKASLAPAAPGAKPVDTLGSAETVDEQARFLAGMELPESSALRGRQGTRAWKSYAKALDADWASLQKQRLELMRDWGSKTLTPKIDPKAPVFYLFGGPDFLSVSVLYPDAPVYILCGLEPLGKVPALAGLSDAATAEALNNLRLSLNSIMRLSYFKTNDMVGDLARTELRGILPVLYVFVARADAKLLEVTRVEIDDQGGLNELGEAQKPAGVPGVRLRIQRAGRSAPQDIYYFKHNVEDSVITAGPGFYAFFRRYAPANTFLKAASFLLHRPKQFGRTHDFLLDHSRSILQDDSGLPFGSLSKDRWSVSLFGTYLRPRSPFRGRLQEDMAAAFKAGPVEPLPFVTGYRRAGESNLVLALAKPGGARSADPKAPAAKAPAKAAESKPAEPPAAGVKPP